VVVDVAVDDPVARVRRRRSAVEEEPVRRAPLELGEEREAQPERERDEEREDESDRPRAA
jgi:hypothetical protein